MRDMCRQMLRRVVAVVAVAAAGLVVVPEAAAQPVDEANQLLSDWQIDQAAEMIEKMGAEHPDVPGVQFLQARYDFLQGEYGKAGSRLDQLLNNTDSRGEWKRFRKLVEQTSKATEGYDKYTSDGGRFEFYVESGSGDQVLVPYAAEALEKAYEAIGEELGYKPETPIRVEVYPQTSTLAQVSGLTEKEIRQSGTIALCKYNRLMITSPRALLQGYGWVDTLVHEYIHFVINKKTRNRVPIWMHEGLAKYLERRWRGPDAHQLPPSTERILEKRVEKGDLISFEQMHPSMAKLPSQEDAATAFAEVFTVMEYLREKTGASAFRDLLEVIGEVDDPKEAFGRVVGEDFTTFERDWKQYLRERETRDYPDEYGYKNKKVFKDENKEKKLGEFDQPKAEEHLKLGEMLQSRKRFEAAAVQYRKAVNLTEAPNPRLRTQFAGALTETGEPEEALSTLQPVRDLYPTYLQIWLRLGEASLAAEQLEDAERYLREAAWINPFNPEVHDLLADTYEKLGQPDKAERERKFAKIVQ